MQMQQTNNSFSQFTFSMGQRNSLPQKKKKKRKKEHYVINLSFKLEAQETYSALYQGSIVGLCSRPLQDILQETDYSFLNEALFSTRNVAARKLKSLYFKCYLTKKLLLLNCGFWTFLNECFRQLNHSLSHNVCFILHQDHPITLILCYLKNRYLMSITPHTVECTLMSLNTHFNAAVFVRPLFIQSNSRNIYNKHNFKMRQF